MARSRKKGRGWRRKLTWVATFFAAFIAILAFTARYLAQRVEPFVREQTLDYLRARFDGEVELGRIDVSMPIRDPFRVLLEKGKGAHIRVRIDDIKVRHQGRRDIAPLLLMERLEFRLELPTLWERPVRVDYVKLAELELTIPPKGQRPRLDGMRGDSDQASHPAGSEQGDPGKPAVLIDHVDLDGMKLVVLPRNPAKQPLEFEMMAMRLESAGYGVPMRYKTVMRNAKPPGLIECSGTFGPFVQAEPGESPVTGEYSFTNADLGVFGPIAGKLDSTGRFSGKLNMVVVDGKADIPDFQLKSAGNAVPLKATFHAIVDGTDGDTLLQPVDATLGRSSLNCRGGIARDKDEAKKTINLDVTVSKGRIEDFLRLAVRGTKPPLQGDSRMQFRMRVPPGAGKVLNRIILDGTFSLQDAAFTSPTVQEKIDEISRRTQGKPSAAEIQGVTSDFEGTFQLKRGILDLSRLIFSIPGADVLLDGWYDVNTEKMDFRGVVRTSARVSQMVKTPWKRVLLKPVDPFFAKDGSGAVIRIAITGTRSNPQFGRDKQKEGNRPGRPSGKR